MENERLTALSLPHIQHTKYDVDHFFFYVLCTYLNERRFVIYDE